MACPIEVQDKFGPVIAATCYHGFDLTLLFEQVFLCLVPAAVLAVLTPVRLWQISRHRPVFRPGFVYFLKLASLAVHLTSQIALLVTLCVSGFVPKTRACIPAAALTLLAALLSLGLSHLEHLRSVGPSALLSLYLGLTLLFDVVRARTLWAIQDNQVAAIVFSVGVGIKSVAFIAKSLGKDPSVSCRETSSNILARSLFWWLNPLLWRGFRNILSVEDLPAIDGQLGTREAHCQFWHRWQAWPQKTAGGMVKMIISAHRLSILQGLLPRLALSGFTFAQPFLITQVISFATTPKGGLETQIGNGLIGATALIYIGLAVSNANSQHMTYRVITRFRASLVSLIYEKTLGVTLPAAQEATAVTLMSADVERTESGLKLMHEVWASPIDLGLGFYLLQRQLGPAAAAPGVLFVLCSASGFRVAASMGQRQRLWLEAISQRIRATSQALAALKEVRMGGLQPPSEDQLGRLRSHEIEASRPFKNALAMIVCLSYATAAMGPVLSLGIFSLLAKRNNTEPLTADKGFTALTVFSLLRAPMANLLDATAGLVGSLGAMQRIGDYLATQSHGGAGRMSAPRPPAEALEKEDGDVGLPLMGVPSQTTLAPSPAPGAPIVSAMQYSAGWSAERGFVLHDMSFTLRHGALTAVVGPVGCGKSTLLHALLGETPVRRGGLHTGFDGAALVGQPPWLISDTVQNNIVGTARLEPEWYARVVEACVLGDDIARMPHGDQELVDGGARRAPGRRHERAGRAHRARLFANLLGPRGLLRGGDTTVVWATNAVHRLAAADDVLVLSADGRLVEHGPYALLQALHKHGQAGHGAHEDAPRAPPACATAASQLAAANVSGSQRRTGDATVYRYYARAIGWRNMGVFLSCGAVFVVALILPSYLVRWWAAENARRAHGQLGLYLGAYFGLGGLALVGLAAGCLQLVARIMPRASMAFHGILLQTTLSAPLSVLRGSAVGETVNRFAQDLQLIDMELPLALFNTSIELLSSVANLVVIAIAAGVIGTALPAVLLVFFAVQNFYLRTARQLRLLDIEAKAPLVSHFLETCTGLATLRAYGAEDDYRQRLMDRLDRSQKPHYLLFSVQRWLNLVLDLIVAAIAVVFIAVAVKLKGRIDTGLVGTALVGIVNFSVSIKALLENWTNLETCVGAVSRVRSFTLETPSEHKPGEDRMPPPEWPAEGRIAYRDVVAAWDGDDEPVVRHLSLVVEPGQKLAVCGRTGSGKSSLVSALFRLLEPRSGAITIDGLDIAHIPRQALRERLICVPQTPWLRIGTARANVDPFGRATDTAILDALAQVQMLDVIKGLGGLDVVIDGDTLSVGQRQLVCLARATLRPGSILVLDEATASLDWETDAIVNDVICTAFARHTIVAIVHRLAAIADYDRVAVIAAGRLAEYGAPADLLADPQSMFAQLHRISAGPHDVTEDKARSTVQDEEHQGDVGSDIISLGEDVMGFLRAAWFA